MKRFPIFRKGRHTASSGATLDFSEDALREAVAAYDPALHEAPIVVGHPRENGPAYGWIGSLSFDEDTGEIVAEPKQIDPAFSELVQAGRFKKRSASWYLPDAPTNPKPGTLYLRHVGFLGAQPPAVKGLRDVSFSGSDEGVVEFAEIDMPYFARMVSNLARRMREWLISDKGIEEADKVIPDYLVAGLEEEARNPSKPEPAMQPAFSEEDPMKIEELQARVTALEAENATLKANQKPADFAEREAGLAQREAALAAREATASKAAIEQRVDAAIAAGRLLKGQRAATVAFASSLADGEAVIDFGEGEKLSLREAYLRQIESAPPAVEFGELAPASAGGAGQPPIEQVQRNLMSQVAGGGKAK